MRGRLLPGRSPGPASMSFFRRSNSIELDYPIHPRPRYGYGKPPHELLRRVIDAHRAGYKSALQDCLSYKSDIWQIGVPVLNPVWVNGFLTAFDAVSLYSLIRRSRPRRYIEIGSGYSTRFARKSIEDGGLQTSVLCIDPRPRADIRTTADRIIEQPVEDADLALFDSLESGDILFVDHSHRVFTNSDATVVFLDILPKLKPGVLVQFHDIFLPADYPPEWNDRYYSEQYLLACYLLSGAPPFEIVLANSFISGDPELSSVLAELWSHPAMKGAETHGCSFWVRIAREPPA
jgi:hypothetical protein